MSPFTFDYSTLDKPLIAFILISYCAGAIGKFFLFHKVKENGYNGVLPFYSDYILFDKCWDVKFFYAYIIAFAALLFMPYMSDAPEAFAGLISMVYCMLAFLYSIRLARSMGKGYPYLILVCVIPAAAMILKLSNIYVFLGLFINPLLMLVLGLDKKALYQGKID